MGDAETQDAGQGADGGADPRQLRGLDDRAFAGTDQETTYGAYRTGTDLPIRITSNISRADLAEFLLREVVEGRFDRETLRIVS